MPLPLLKACAGFARIVVPAIFGWVGLMHALAQAPARGQGGVDAEPGWPQFRGPGGRSVSEGPRLPLTFGPGTNLFWEAAVPPGNSSPIVTSGRVVLTGYEENSFKTVCLDAASGKVVWVRAVTSEKVESAHRIGSVASPTPVTDGERVFVYFGSHGLLAFGLNGEPLWEVRLPPPVVEFGASTSPIVVGNKVVLNCDQDLGSFMLAVDKRTGKEVWRADRSEFRRGFATPFVWENGRGKTELVVPGSLRLTGYDPDNGREVWTVLGTSRVACSSPTSGGGLLFSSSWNLGGDSGARIEMPGFSEFAAAHDANHDGLLTAAEMPAGPVKERFTQMDLNKDGLVTLVEWEEMAGMFAKAENSLIAVRAGGAGNITKSHVAWKITRSLPYVASPLFYKGRLYTVRSGGMLSCYEASTGKPLYLDERLGAIGDYYASPLASGDYVYVIAQSGAAVAVRAGDKFEVVSRNELGVEVMASPAVAQGTLFIRTGGRLYAFRNKQL